MAGEVARITKLFFDKSKVTQYLDKKSIKVLGKFGGLVRKTAQRSMRSRKKGVRKGGTGPPYAHKNPLLKKLLFYSLDTKNKSVIIGPILLDKTAKLGVPSLLEHGGTVTQLVKGRPVTRVYKGNEFMQPAFALHVGKVAAMYKEQV